MKKKNTLSIVIVILLCLVLVGEVFWLVRQQQLKKLTHEHDVFEIMSSGNYPCDLEIRREDGTFQSEQFFAGLISPLSFMSNIPAKASLAKFDDSDWLYRFTFHSFTLDPVTNAATPFDIVVIIGPENMQIDGSTYTLSKENWELFFPLLESNLEAARQADFGLDE